MIGLSLRTHLSAANLVCGTSFVDLVSHVKCCVSLWAMHRMHQREHKQRGQMKVGRGELGWTAETAGPRAHRQVGLRMHETHLHYLAVHVIGHLMERPRLDLVALILITLRKREGGTRSRVGLP